MQKRVKPRPQRWQVNAGWAIDNLGTEALKLTFGELDPTEDESPEEIARQWLRLEGIHLDA